MDYIAYSVIGLTGLFILVMLYTVYVHVCQMLDRYSQYDLKQMIDKNENL